jgi:hypothetical protein
MAEQEQESSEYFKKHIPESAWQHAKNAREELRKSWETLLPPEFIVHRRKARMEMLLAARELINHALDRLQTYEEASE